MPTSARAPQNNQTPQWSESAVIAVYVPTPPKPKPKPVVVPVRLKAVTTATLQEGVGNGQCVDYVQANGFAGYSGNAYQWKKYINTKTPSAGDAIVLREGNIGHVAIVSAVSSQSIQLVEQNYKGRYVVSSRSVSLDYDRIVGFISPPVASSSQDLLLR